MKFHISPSASGFLSAALRHIRDAEHLADASNPGRSLDQAYHLAGFGPECARKATLSSRVFDKSLGHDFGLSSNQVLDFATAVEPFAHCYSPYDWNRLYPALSRWSEGSRYKRTGTCQESEVKALVSDARRAVDRVFFLLWADGRLAQEWDLDNL